MLFGRGASVCTFHYPIVRSCCTCVRAFVCFALAWLLISMLFIQLFDVSAGGICDLLKFRNVFKKQSDGPSKRDLYLGHKTYMEDSVAYLVLLSTSWYPWITSAPNWLFSFTTLSLFWKDWARLWWWISIDVISCSVCLRSYLSIKAELASLKGRFTVSVSLYLRNPLSGYSTTAELDLRWTSYFVPSFLLWWLNIKVW